MSHDIEQQDIAANTEATAAIFGDLAKQNPILLIMSDHPTPPLSYSQTMALSKNQVQSVHALLSYVAYNKHVKEDDVKPVIKSRFNVNHIEELPEASYEDVIRFLVDLCVEEILN
jgi:hypothetical protein